MAVKIFIGGEDAIPALLAKQKASWEKVEKSADDFGKSAAKAERQAIAHGKNLVKQHRSAQQALKDRVAAIQAAAKKGEITEKQKIETIRKVIAKYNEESAAAKEAALKGTEAFKKQAKQVERGKRSVDRLIDSTKTLSQKNRALKGDIRRAYEAGEIGADDMKAAIIALNVKQDAMADRHKNTLGPNFKGLAANAVSAIGGVGAAWIAARKLVQKYSEEKDKALSETNKLNESRSDLKSLNADFSKLEKVADKLASDETLGITRIESRKLGFAANSTGFANIEDQRTVAKAKAAGIPIAIGSEAGRLRRLFAREELSIENTIDTISVAASSSAGTASQLLPQITKASQGASGVGASSAEIAAMTSVLYGQLGNEAGQKIKSFESSLQMAQRTMPGLAGKSPVQALMALGENKSLRDSFIGENRELMQVTEVGINSLRDFEFQGRRQSGILRTLKEIKHAQRDDVRPVMDKRKAVLDPLTRAGAIEIEQMRSIAAEQAAAITNEKKFAEGAFRTNRIIAEEEKRVSKYDLTMRTGSSVGINLASMVSSDPGFLRYASRSGEALGGMAPGGDTPSLGYGAIEQAERRAAAFEEKFGKRLREAEKQTEVLERIESKLEGSKPLTSPYQDR